MSGKDFVKRLEKDGWKCDRISGSHYIMLKDGFLPASIPVHGNKDLPAGTLNKLLKETGLKGR